MSGVAVLQAIQSVHSPVLDQVAYAITQIHHETVYILMVAILLWVYDKRFTHYLVSVFLLGFWANNVLKYTFDTVRPSPDIVRVLHPETGTGPAFPSGHSQNPLMVWGALALQVRRNWFAVSACVLIFLIGLSRLYMGLHWPLDVMGGWAIGALMLWGFEATRAFWTGERMGITARLALAVLVPLATIPLSEAAIPSPMPRDVWILTGAYLGFWVGSVLEAEYVGFDPRRGSFLTQIAKVLLGLALVFAVKEGMKLFVPGGPPGDFIRYVCIALTASLGAPWLFHRFLVAPPAGHSMSQ